MLTQKITSITASFWGNVAAIVLFYTPSAKYTKAICGDYAGELSQDKYKSLISKLKEQKLAHIAFSLRQSYRFELFSIKKMEVVYIVAKQRRYTMAEEELAMAEAMNLLEAEPSSGPAGITVPGPTVLALRKQVAVLVSTGKVKYAIGVQLSCE